MSFPDVVQLTESFQVAQAQQVQVVDFQTKLRFEARLLDLAKDMSLVKPSELELKGNSKLEVFLIASLDRLGHKGGDLVQQMQQFVQSQQGFGEGAANNLPSVSKLSDISGPHISKLITELNGRQGGNFISSSKLEYLREMLDAFEQINRGRVKDDVKRLREEFLNKPEGRVEVIVPGTEGRLSYNTGDNIFTVAPQLG